MSYRHWNVRYIRDRVAVAWYERRHPDYPWMTAAANAFLAQWLRPSDSGAEFGSGRSTVWFASHVGRLLSVETDAGWGAKVHGSLQKAGITNVDYRCMQINDASSVTDWYLQIAGEIEDQSLDFVIVDADCRDICARAMLSKVRPGGILVIDNVNRHLPSNSHSPASRRMADGPDGPIWAEVANTLALWRVFWTSSGVTDTAIYFKPGNHRNVV